MHKEGEEIHIDTTEASGGSKEGVVRYILLIGTVLAIVALTIVWTTGAFTQDETESEISVSNKIANQEDGDSTDSIVSDNADQIEGAVSEDPVDTPVDVVEN